MCGIVGAISKNNIIDFLIDGLQHLEYRGYDSAGMAIVDNNTNELVRIRCLGKVQELANTVLTNYKDLQSNIGISHTRWATHGSPSEINAHPHISENIAVVHNGIIENYEILRKYLISCGFQFKSQTDTEVIAHLIKYFLNNRYPRLAPIFDTKTILKLNQFGTEVINSEELDLLTAVKMVLCVLEGAYGMVVIDVNCPNELIAARSGSPLVIGVTDSGIYLASDPLALIDKTNKFIYLEEGDVAKITLDTITIYDSNFIKVDRAIVESNMKRDASSKGEFDSFMLKEIFEQPQAIIDTIEQRIVRDHVLIQAIGSKALEILPKVEHVQIIACGTSYHAGLVAKYWIEHYANVSCEVDIASEYRYRFNVTRPNSLIICISQSGETADTLAALRKAKNSGFLATMAICNVASSSLVRESDLVYLTRCGVEIGVASTKAFTSQLVVLLMFTVALAQAKNNISNVDYDEVIKALNHLPININEILTYNDKLKALTDSMPSFNSCIFIGRDVLYPIMKEADLKLKELSYIHSEAFAGGELKHGPLALVDENMPVFALCPNNNLIDKMHSNIEEVLARKGRVYLFTDNAKMFEDKENLTIIEFPPCSPITAPIYYTVAYQLIAYNLAIKNGCDVDKPRNLAKSVTVE